MQVSINKYKRLALSFIDSLDYMESLLTLFDLQDRSNTEVLVHLIIKKL